MVEDLQWFGLHWNRGYLCEDFTGSLADMPQVEVPSSSSTAISSICREFVQSKRFALYERAWRILYERGYLYPCRLSRKDVDLALSAPHDNVSPQINGGPLPPPPSSIAAEQGEVIFPPHLRPDFIQSVPYGTGDNSHFPVEYQGLVSPKQPLPPVGSSVLGKPTAAKTVNWRFRVPDIPTDSQNEGEISFDDINFGRQIFRSGIDFGDFLVWRSDGYPSYELAVIVDDIVMGVREVVRGQDLVLSTARQLLLIKALFGLDYRKEESWWSRFPRDHLASSQHREGHIDRDEESEDDSSITEEEVFSLSSSKFRIPRYFHCPLMLDENGQRMAKRNFSKGLRKLREEGISPEEVKRKHFNRNLCYVLPVNSDK